MLLAVVGCNHTPTVDELVDQAAELQGVRESRHSKLRQEFRLVEQSKTLPEQLNTDASLTHKNAAVALNRALSDLQRVTEINNQAAQFLGALPAGDQAFVKAEGGALSAKWLHETQDVVEASQFDACDFGVKFERGYFNKLDFVYQAAAASRLLQIDALYHLDEQPELSLERFAAAWQWTDWLAATGVIEARVQAALLRGDALNVAEVIANRHTTTTQLLAIQGALQQSIDNWPSMQSTLVRERAMTLAAYEAIRLGMVDLLFTLDERSMLREQGVYDSLRTAKPNQIDADEAAYLAYMREVIAVADQPFYARSKHLVECDRLLRAGEHTDSFPWFANHLFVLDNSLTLAQAEIARDRARVEGWLHLLTTATGQPVRVGELNPLNGQKYSPQYRGNEWYVALGDRRSINPRLTLPKQ